MYYLPAHGLPTNGQPDYLSIDLFKQVTNGGFDFFDFVMSQHGVRLKDNNNFQLKNPFYADKNGSMSINRVGGQYLLNDFGYDGNDRQYQGDVIDFAGFYYKLDPKHDIHEILKRACADLNINLERISENRSEKNASTKQIPGIILKQCYSDTDLLYWQKYGITEDTLQRFGVYAVESYPINNSGGSTQIYSSGNQLVFAYKVNDSCHKIYKPNDQKYKFIWIGQKPKDYIFGFGQLPGSGDTVFVCAGEKDTLTVVSHGYPAITLNSETAGMPDELAGALKARFKNVVVLYDLDDTGRISSRKLCEKHGLKQLVLPEELVRLGLGKDVSDYFLASAMPEYGGMFCAGEFNKMIEQAVSATISPNSLISITSLKVSPENQILKVADLLKKEVAETKWLVKGLLPEGYCILAGRPKSGKSWLSLLLACSAALGYPFLGTFEIRKTGVLLLALEDNEARLKLRVQKILSSLGQDETSIPENFHYLIDIPALDKGGDQIIENYLNQYPDTGLIIHFH